MEDLEKALHNAIEQVLSNMTLEEMKQLDWLNIALTTE